MLTQKEFICIRSLVETENQLIYHLNESYENLSEPQFREEIQKIMASVTNQKNSILEFAEENI